MNKIKLLGVALMALMFLGSCSGPSEREVTAKDVEISGLANKYLKVVDGSYKFTNNGNDAFITVKFELKKKPSEKICQDYVYGGFRINATGESGEIFNTGVYGFKTEDNDVNKIIDLINTGDIGAKKSISFKWDYYGVSKDDGKPIFNKATSFEVIDDRTFIFCSEKEKETTTISSDNNNSSSTTKETGNSEDWDAVLKSYENYIDQYIKLMKKAQNGDMDALTEYAKMMENATELSEKMSNAGDDMSASQMAKYMKLQTKLANAAADMSQK